MKKTATVTWITYENYGTCLQAYALQHVLETLGYENIIVDDRRFIPQKGLKGHIGTFLSILNGKKIPSRHTYFQSFKSHNMKIDDDWGTLSELDNKYDIFLCGSDQIWSPNVRFNPFYYLSFTNKKKIAYAPSTGTGNLPQEFKDRIKPFIECFTKISVREKSGALALSRFIDKPISVTLDPTLLLSAEEWKKVEITPESQGQYLLCYFLTPNQWYMDYVQEYSRKTGVKIKIFFTNPLYKNYGDEQLIAGPGEFIGYIHNAHKVFTDSFHAAAFSIMYRKDFVAFKRFKDGAHLDQNARIADLFAELGLESHFVGDCDLKEMDNMPLLNYEIIFKKIETLKTDSINYLKSALSM